MHVPSRTEIEQAARAGLGRLTEALQRLVRRLDGAHRRGALRASRWRAPEEIRLRQARRGLWKAELLHRLRVTRARVELGRAQRTYRRGCQRAERAVRKAEKVSADAVSRADAHLRDVGRPREIASYGPFSLRDDSLHSPEWDVSLASVHAVILPAESAALKGVGSGALPRSDPQHHPRRSRLALRSRQGESSHDFPRRDGDAREFARLVNIASLNAGRFDQQRREDMSLAAEHLEETRLWAATRLAAAQKLLDATLSDTAALDAARGRLAQERHDTSEIDARREAVAALENEARAARLGIPPDPEDVPTE